MKGVGTTYKGEDVEFWRVLTGEESRGSVGSDFARCKRGRKACWAKLG